MDLPISEIRDLSLTKYIFDTTKKVGGQDCAPLGRPHYIIIVGQLQQGAEFKESSGPSQRSIAILARIEINLLHIHDFFAAKLGDGFVF